MHAKLIAIATIGCLTVGSLRAQAPLASGPPLEEVGALRRNALAAYPTRLANVYFPELTLGYRRRLGADGLWALGVSAGPTFSEEQPSRRGLGEVWGFGIGLECRRYWFDSPAGRADPFFAIGAEASRAYYDSFRGLESVPGTEWARVVEARTFSKRHEAILALGVDFAWSSGFLVDVRLGLAYLSVGYDVLDGELAPVEVDPFWRQPPHSSTRLLLDAREDFLRPRLRIGVGWCW